MKKLLLALPILLVINHGAEAATTTKPSPAAIARQDAKNRKAATAAYQAGMHTMHAHMNITYTGDADIDFVTGMIPHHQGAVDMARVELAYGKSPEMLALAKRIIINQEAEIGFMQTWLDGRRSNYRMQDADHRSSVIAYKKAMSTMHEGMMVGYVNDADIDFARGMIPHNQGAVDMADILVQSGKSLELRKFAHDIIRSQGQEIAQMQDWLKTQNIPQPKVIKTTKKSKTHEHNPSH